MNHNEERTYQNYGVRIGRFILNLQQGSAIHIELIRSGNNQPPTLEVTNIVTGKIFVNDNIFQCISHENNMRYYWVMERIRKGEFLVYWVSEELHLVDYFKNNNPKKS